MKFAEKYLDAQYGDELAVCLVKLGETSCCVCKEPTEFYDLDYDCALCSEECRAEMDWGYAEALNLEAPG